MANAWLYFHAYISSFDLFYYDYDFCSHQIFGASMALREMRENMYCAEISMFTVHVVQGNVVRLLGLVGTRLECSIMRIVLCTYYKD